MRARTVLLAVALGGLAASQAMAAACREEAERLASRHALVTSPDEPNAGQELDQARGQARSLLQDARAADDEGVVERCLHRLAEARSLLEPTFAAPEDGPRPNR